MNSWNWDSDPGCWTQIEAKVALEVRELDRYQ